MLPLLTSDRSKDKTFRSELLLSYFGESNLGTANGVCPELPGILGFIAGQNMMKTPPYYNGTQFCACLDAANNTWNCLRILNSTSNTLYCEYNDTVKFVEYFNVAADPYELKNIASVVSEGEIAQLHNDLQQQLKCVGANCHSNGVVNSVPSSIL